MAPVVPCDSCGNPISDSDLETGTAITMLGKHYCSACKTEAIQSVSLDEIGSKAPAAKAAAPKATAPRPAPPKAPARAAAPAPPPKPGPKPERKAASPSAARRPVAAAAKPPSRTPLLIAVVGVVVVLGIVGGVVLTRGDSGAPVEGAGGTKGGKTAPTKIPDPGPDREAAAKEAFAKVDEMARRTGTSWDLLLAAADKARPVCKGTAQEKKLEEIRARALQEKEAEEASRELTPLIDELKGAVATDPEFKRFAELQPKFQLALEMAAKTGSVKRDEIRALQREYNGKYESLAEPHYTRINEAATALAEERRWDDALRQINSFPQHLRHSGAWTSLDKLRQDIERRKKSSPK